MRLQALHCPNCGAAIGAPTGGPTVVCSYCKLSLAVERERVTSPSVAPREQLEGAAFQPPEATLFTRESPRFFELVTEVRESLKES